MSVPPCKDCGAAENRPCIDTGCGRRTFRAQLFRLHINSYKSAAGGWPDHRLLAWGFEKPFPENWREILEAGADD